MWGKDKAREGLILYIKQSTALKMWNQPGVVVVVHTCNPSTREVEAGGSKAQGHPQLPGEFEGSLGYV